MDHGILGGSMENEKSHIKSIFESASSRNVRGHIGRVWDYLQGRNYGNQRKASMVAAWMDIMA